MPLILTPQNFVQLGDDADSFCLELGTSVTPLPTQPPERERLRFILVGSPLSVTRTIQTLDLLGFVELHRWSQLVMAPEQLRLHPQPGEVLSILTRQFQQASNPTA